MITACTLPNNTALPLQTGGSPVILELTLYYQSLAVILWMVLCRSCTRVLNCYKSVTRVLQEYYKSKRVACVELGQASHLCPIKRIPANGAVWCYALVDWCGIICTIPNQKIIVVWVAVTILSDAVRGAYSWFPNEKSTKGDWYNTTKRR
jgi:hypothetical protein